MSTSIRISVYAFLLVSFLIGCIFQQKVPSQSLSLPEEIYVTPQQNYHKALKVGLFKFTDPPNAPGLGKASAQYLYRELLKNKVFSDVTLEIDVADTQISNLIEIADAQKYDLIITGDIFYYFEGGNYESSHVEEEIRVIRVNDKKTQTLWHAGATAIGLPTPSTDFIFKQRNGDPAPAAMALIKRNAKKFGNLFLTASPRRQPVPKSTSYRRQPVPKSTYPTTQLSPKSTMKGYSRPVSGYKKAGALNPRYAWAYQNRGAAGIKQGNYSSACNDLQKACELGVCSGLNWAKQKGYCKAAQSFPGKALSSGVK
jgi:hypothetical protein